MPNSPNDQSVAPRADDSAATTARRAAGWWMLWVGARMLPSLLDDRALTWTRVWHAAVVGVFFAGAVTAIVGQRRRALRPLASRSR